MTIEEAISWLVSIADYVGDDVPIYNEDTVAIETAMNIMRKYQKIEEIYKNWFYGADSYDCMKDIERVILDEDND